RPSSLTWRLVECQQMQKRIPLLGLEIGTSVAHLAQPAVDVLDLRNLSVDSALELLILAVTHNGCGGQPGELWLRRALAVQHVDCVQAKSDPPAYITGGRQIADPILR